jgi:hypothetical protein
MYWRVTYGANEVFKHGTPRQASWKTLKRALEFARQQLQEGDRVTQIIGPSGEVLDENRILELAHVRLSVAYQSLLRRSPERQCKGSGQ